MLARDKKMVVLRQLSQKSAPTSLQDLLRELGQEFKERTVRRWLNELIEEGVVKKTGNKRGTKYLSIKNHQGQTASISSCFSEKSLEALKNIKRPIYERFPIPYAREWIESYQPNKTYYLSEQLQSELFSVGKRTHSEQPAGTYAHQIFNRLLIDLSYNSSRLEGNTYSLLDTEKLLLHGSSAEGKLDTEKVMILNHKEAIRYLVDNAYRLEINQNTICTLHYLLSDGLLPFGEVGKIRKHSVRIGGSSYIPFENPKHLENLLQIILEKGAKIENPFEQSLFLLIHISYLQAFADVNKRTARLSANIPLIKKNLVPLAFSDIQVDDYMSTMIAIYELQDPQPLIDLYVYSYMRTCAAYDATIKALDFDEVRVRYRMQRRQLLREILVNKYTKAQVADWISLQAKKIIPSTDQKDFIGDVLEDLEAMDEVHLAGLDVSVDELKAWKKVYNK